MSVLATTLKKKHDQLSLKLGLKELKRIQTGRQEQTSPGTGAA